jgi:ComF family protein
LILARHLADAGATTADIVIAVPLHRGRLVERGYNQALEIARPVASELGLPLWISGIRRKRATQPLAALGASARRVGVRGAFSVTRDLEGLNVAIVDDVITTGATVNALAATLRKAGAHRIEAWAVARAL